MPATPYPRGQKDLRRRLVVWRFTDGKAGHASQSQGLVEALGRRVRVDEIVFDVCEGHRALFWWMRGVFPPGAGQPDPDILVGAGHRTHGAMLAACRARGGQNVVLMRPSWPLGLFDYAVIPEHDGVPAGSSVIATKGVLNAIRPAVAASPQRGLILLGGPSKHHDWDTPSILDGVRLLAEGHPEQQWTLTTSRRTPAETLERLGPLHFKNLQVVPLAQTGPGWVAEQLQACGCVVVSEDSISMVFEALSAGAAVALLPVPARSCRSRVQAAIGLLKAEGRVSVVGESAFKNPPGPPLAEADRVAGWLLKELAACGAWEER